ncbi:hypothetical protein QYF61_008171 [Mycteria americana]|uniref:Uncharacterized protein n=1 Tax=Mycteria americana TaxID=33587 RepID=A0AAN7PY73_MYCAM|nr:hypothetical protein QYF61_008171 [Mycteria americana]
MPKRMEMATGMHSEGRIPARSADSAAGIAYYWGEPRKNTLLSQWMYREEKVSGSDDKATGTVATPTSTTGTVAAPTPVTGTAATPTPATGTAAEPENQPVLVSVVPIHKKKSWRQKSAHLEREEEKAGPSQGEDEEEEEVINEAETT